MRNFANGTFIKKPLSIFILAAIFWLNIFSAAQAESQFLGSKIPMTSDGRDEFGDTNLFNHLIVQGNWVWKVERVQGVYNWTDPDNELAFAEQQGLDAKYQGIWYPSYSQDWLTAGNIKQELTDYTRDLFERYYVEKGQHFEVLRVINEIASDNNRRQDLEVGLLEDGEIDETGYDWLINLFSSVRSIADEYDPNVKLFINDYGLLGGGSIKPASMRNIINIVNSAEGGPYIDILGCQAHGLENAKGDTIKAALDQFAAETDVEIQITEYDVNKADDAEQLAIYKRQFPVMWEHPAVTGFAFWGFEESYMWSVKANAFLMRADGSDRPALTWLRAYMNSTNTAPVTSFNAPEAYFLPAGSNIAVQVQSNDRDGVERVDLYTNDVFFASVSKTYEMDGYGEHDFVLSDLGVGVHTLKAIAYDNNGLSTTVEHEISVIPPSAPAYPADLVIYAEADAYVRSGSYSDRNWGAGTTLQTRNKDASGRRESFVRFDLSSITNNIESA